MTGPEAPRDGPGGDPEAAAAASVALTRLSSLSSGSVGTFTLDMTSGLGYIALATLLFRRWTPLGGMAAALLFGFTLEQEGLTSSLAWNTGNSSSCQAARSAA